MCSSGEDKGLKIIYSIICENEDVNINSKGKLAVKSTDAVLLCSHGDWLSQGTSSECLLTLRSCVSPVVVVSTLGSKLRHRDHTRTQPDRLAEGTGPYGTAGQVAPSWHASWPRARGSLEANACLKSEIIKICLNVPGVARILPVFPVEHGGKMLLLFWSVVLLLRLLLKVLSSEIHIIGCCLHLHRACTSLVVSLAKQDKLDGAFTMSSLINAHLYGESTHGGVSLCIHKAL